MNVFLIIWSISLLVKLLIAYFLPLFSDEAYYWVWSHNLQLSYFDHPPMVAWLLSLGHFFENWGGLARLPLILVSHLTLLIWGKILKPWLNLNERTWFLILALLNPLFGLGAFVATPDIPLLFFWSVSILFFQNYITQKNIQNVVFLGAALGLGFCSKYHIVLLPLIIFIWIFTNQEFKKIPLSHFVVGFCTGLFFSLPVLIWNFQNDFVSFKFQIDHGLNRQSNFIFPIKYLTEQILLIFPVILYILLKNLKNNWKHFLTVAGLLPLVFFFFSSLKSRVEANWTVPAFPALFALFLLSKPSKVWIRMTATVWGLIFVIVIFVALTKFPPELYTKSKLRELDQYNDIKIWFQYEPLYAGSYQMAASLSFLAKRPIYKLRNMNRIDFYDFLPESIPDKAPIYVIVKRDQSVPDWIRRYEDSVLEERGDFILHRFE